MTALALFVAGLPLSPAAADPYEYRAVERSQTVPATDSENAAAKASAFEIPSGSILASENPLSLSNSDLLDKILQDENITFHVYAGQSIQAAVQNAQAGDTVYVHAGTYHERITLKVGVRLQGESAGTTILSGDFGAGESVVRALGNNVIEGLSVTGGKGAASAIQIQGDHVEILQNRIQDNLSAGIDISAGLSDIRIEQNLFLRNQTAIQNAQTGNQIQFNTISGPETAPWVKSVTLNYLAGQGTRLDIQNVPGVYSYFIEYTDSLGEAWKRVQVQVGGIWTDLNLMASTGAVTMWIDDGSSTGVSPLTTPMRFYRVKAAETASAGMGIKVAALEAPVIQNNIITNQQIQSIWETDSSSVGAQVRNNVLFNNQESGAGTGHLPSAISPKTGENWTDGNLLANPQFQNPDNNDYSVAQISPAYSSGAFLPETLKTALLRAASIHRNSNSAYSIEKISSSGVLTGWRILYGEGSQESFYLNGTTELDTTGPAVTILSALTLTNQTSYLLSYTVDGVEKTEPRTLAEGVNNLKAEATDIFGNKTTKTLTVTLDTTPPVITVTSEEATDSSQYTLKWKVDGGVEVSREVTLIPGENPLTIDGTDLAGNSGTLNLRVVYVPLETGHGFTNNGVVLDSNQSVFGGTSGYFSGTNSYLSFADHEDWALGSGDFTIDFRARFQSLPAPGQYQSFVSQWMSGRKSFTTLLYNEGGTYKFIFYYSTDGVVVSAPIGGAISPSVNTWAHFAVVRSAGEIRTYMNGAQMGEVFNAGTDAFLNAPDPMTIGVARPGVYPFSGNLDEVRISKTARWTGTSFSVPASEYAQDANTKLLLHLSSEEFQNQVEILPWEDPRIVAAPTLQSIPVFTNQTSLLLSGEKPANTSIWINGVEVVPSHAGTTWSCTYPLTAEGVNSVSIVANNTFNFSSPAVPASTTRDTVPPTGHGVINGGDASATSPSINLSLSAQDTVSGLSQMRFSMDGGIAWSEWENYAVAKNLTLPLGNGNKEVRAQIKDLAGNIGNFSSSILLDTVVTVETKQDVRKVFILGPLTDAAGSLLNYTYTAASNLLSNGQFSLIKNQLAYTPKSGFFGSGIVSVQAGAYQAKFEIRVTAPSINTPNDPRLTAQYGLSLTNAVRAWSLSQGAGVPIAIIDSGIGAAHVDLNDNIYTNPGEVAGDGIDNDQNGYVDDVHGWDFENGDNHPDDDVYHGTHVAGIAAAERGNALGGSGMAPQAKLMALKVLGLSSVSIDRVFQDIANAIYYAVRLGVKVINISLGLSVSQISASVVTAVQNALNAAYDAGALVVVAAGNENSNVSNFVPSGLHHVIVVSATNSFDGRACCNDLGGYFSNFGTGIDISAPGERILSTYYGEDDDGVIGSHYDYGSGTSMASPFVAGLAALMAAQDPEITEDDFIRRLRFSSRDLGASGWDSIYGYGRIDAFKALSYDYYDTGVIKTQWLESPDENGWRRLDFDSAGYLTGGSTLLGRSALPVDSKAGEEGLENSSFSIFAQGLDFEENAFSRSRKVFRGFLTEKSENRPRLAYRELFGTPAFISPQGIDSKPDRNLTLSKVSRKPAMLKRHTPRMEGTPFGLNTIKWKSPLVQKWLAGIQSMPQVSWMQAQEGS